MTSQDRRNNSILELRKYVEVQAGNFGKYDDRIARAPKSFMGFKVSCSISHAIEKTKHNLRLLKHYPEEVLWEPFFRVYHWIWRRFELWRY